MKKILLYFLALIFILIIGIFATNQYEKSQLVKIHALPYEIDKIEVYKSKRLLTLFSEGKPIKSYSISLGGNPKGAKQFEGDEKTPEGVYYINDKNPHSAYYKNLGISYPNQQDQNFANLHQRTAGSDIKIHGLPNHLPLKSALSLKKYDWTKGCIALDNDEMEELYQTIKVGTKIEIFP